MSSGVDATSTRSEDQSGDASAIALPRPDQAVYRVAQRGVAGRVPVAASVRPHQPSVAQALQLALGPAERTRELIANRVASPGALRLAAKQEQQVEHADGVDVPRDQALCVPR